MPPSALASRPGRSEASAPSNFWPNSSRSRPNSSIPTQEISMKGLVAAAALMVDGAGQQGLAGALFAKDQDRGPRPGDRRG